MSKKDKLRKLANVVKLYRGRTIGGKWVQPPQPDKAKRIRELLGLLQFDKEQQDFALRQIDEFKSFDEFHKWLDSL